MIADAANTCGQAQTQNIILLEKQTIHFASVNEKHR
jgi:hypothetical protein